MTKRQNRLGTVEEIVGQVEGDEVLWAPHDGPQTIFLLSDADETLYGGAAGGGKTDALLAVLLEQTEHPDFRGLFLRKTYKALAEVIDRTRALWRKVGATWNQTTMVWTFPSGAMVELGYLEVWADTERYQGRQFTVICYDELTQLVEERCWTFLATRNRAVKPGLRRFMRASANPGGPGHAWVKRRFITPCPPDGTPVPFYDPDSKVTLTRAFVAARLEDNPTLMHGDPAYLAKLNAQPLTIRMQLRYGDWSAGEGMALDELAEHVHLIKPFPIPAHWSWFGSFDWGFAHPFAFGAFAVDGDGTVYLVQSVHGRKKQPSAIASAIREKVPAPVLEAMAYVHAGHDCWADIKARGENTPTIAETFADYGIYLSHANIARIAGLNNFRRYIQWKGMGPPGEDGLPTDGAPRFYIFDTPENRHTWDVLTGMVTDPLNLEDALKVDADADGLGGDDPYDMVRYGLASRPISAPTLEVPIPSIWDPAVLQAEYERKRRVPSGTLGTHLPLPPGIGDLL